MQYGFEPTSAVPVSHTNPLSLGLCCDSIDRGIVISHPGQSAWHSCWSIWSAWVCA